MIVVTISGPGAAVLAARFKTSLELDRKVVRSYDERHITGEPMPKDADVVIIHQEKTS